MLSNGLMGKLWKRGGRRECMVREVGGLELPLLHPNVLKGPNESAFVA